MFNTKNFIHLFNLINNLLFFICGCVVLSEVHEHKENVSNIILSIHIILLSFILFYYDFKNYDNEKIPNNYLGLIYLWNGILLFGLYKIGISIAIISILNGILNICFYIFSSDNPNIIEESSSSLV